ncbi:C-type lectin domain family 17, member A-like isoform X2 [Dreissena polymorpha]|uniref:C-type lectin domain family 17, member A-like isoform X1 n=1 Tax=Dreissena polymorpha TaxID=45954 RepID=UPI0022655294|nr:C-type lectin domain family 17, member A-like isoform X1 [Dreissena polymorpha]XP_052218763.1 C-type lectin domain family 17, member A-like isoform X2 [Dreissena polymorpha]
MWNNRVCIAVCVCLSGCVSYYTTCKDGWLPFRGSCYLFHVEATTFTAAEQYCRQHENSHLVHIDDAIENSFLKDRMRLLKDRYWWIGLRDEDIEGVWKWFDNDEIATFTGIEDKRVLPVYNVSELDFKPGDGGPHDIEDCATAEPGSDYRWVDVDCSVTVDVLCETRGHEEASVIG